MTRELALKRREGLAGLFAVLSFPVALGVAIVAGRLVSGTDDVTAYGVAAFLLAGAAAWGGWIVLAQLVVDRVTPHPDDAA